ncbi:MAG: hypothetical protein HOV77_17110 [Hamadaea sp.]|uniref:hypothetical protein n=1 Tax=Hamadaea sp. TaxID=2024425 RepID=UPI001815CE0B|nr:hypothetical protein [Hamadaea sp.]NUT20901.1 hypothetical protein [Hamadaea sp.]
MSRRSVRVLAAARAGWAAECEHLEDVPELGTAERAAILAATRRWWVRRALMRESPWNRIAVAFSLAAMAVCLLLPPALVAVVSPQLRAAGLLHQLSALVTYLTIFSAISAFYFWKIMKFRVLSRLGLAATVLGVPVVIAAAIAVPQPMAWLAMGLAAAAVAGVVIALGSSMTSATWSNVWGPLWRQPLTTIAPATAALVLLWHLLDQVVQAPRAWNRTASRDQLLSVVFETRMWFEFRLPRALWFAGHRGPEFQPLYEQYGRAREAVTDVGWRLVAARTAADQLDVRRRLAKAIKAVSAGDWQELPEAVPTPQRSMLVIVGRRIVAPLVLTAAALGLPHVTGIGLAGAALTSIQATLLAAAVLSLIPSETATRDRVADALRDRG